MQFQARFGQRMFFVVSFEDLVVLVYGMSFHYLSLFEKLHYCIKKKKSVNFFFAPQKWSKSIQKKIRSTSFLLGIGKRQRNC